VAAAATVLVAITGWILSPRLAVTGPSLIDDWNAYANAGAAAHALLHGPWLTGIRFNPAWVFWNYLQWHVPAQRSMVGPNVANAARVTLALGGIAALAWFVAVRDRQLPRPVAIAAVVLPPLLIVTVPALAIDLARFGPQEPAAAGGLALGLICFLVSLEQPSRTRFLLLTLVGAIAWAIGAYHKETSVCVLLALPLLLPELRALAKRVPAPRLMLVGALAATPILHVLYATAVIVHRGHLEYGSHVHGARASATLALHALTNAVGSLDSPVVAPLFVVAAVTAVRSRVQAAMLIVGFAMLMMSVETGYFVSRYYLPLFALVAIASVRTIVRMKRARLIGASLSILLLVCVLSLPAARAVVARWATADEAGVKLTHAVTRLRVRGCRVIIATDVERHAALNTLAPPRTGKCDATFMVVEPPRRSCAGTLLGRWLIDPNGLEATLIRCAVPPRRPY
jgi:hypothetical protein